MVLGATLVEGAFEVGADGLLGGAPVGFLDDPPVGRWDGSDVGLVERPVVLGWDDPDGGLCGERVDAFGEDALGLLGEGVMLGVHHGFCRGEGDGVGVPRLGEGSG